MFANNFPVDKGHASSDALFDAFAVITASFSSTEEDNLFRANAERIYRLERTLAEEFAPVYRRACVRMPFAGRRPALGRSPFRS
ncbi:MAG: hypothetical protein ACR2IK_16910 [Chloroflexota bacterium]